MISRAMSADLAKVANGGCVIVLKCCINKFKYVYAFNFISVEFMTL